MKYDTLRAFEKHLESSAPGHFSNLYLIIGKEGFECKEAMDALIKALLPAEARQFGLRLFDAEKLSIEDVLTELSTVSFLSERKVIGIQEAEKLKKNEMELLETRFVNFPRTHYLVLVATTLSKASSFYKKAEKAGVVLEFAEAKPWEKEKRLVEWVNHAAAKQRKVISYQVCQALVKQVGLDQSLLEQELEKLLCYTIEKDEIKLEDVKAICSNGHTETIWQLGEAIFSRDAATAMRTGSRILSDNGALLPLLRQIRSQFQTEYQICGLLKSGGGAEAVSRDFPYMRGQILDRHVRLAQSYGMDRFKAGLLAIDAAELQAKNSAVDDELLLELLLVNLTI